jgi:hypothetical protein
VKANPIAAAALPSQTPAQQSTSQVKKLQEEATVLKKENVTLLDERNFYYEKLRRVEVMCQIRQSDEFAAQVQ